FSFFTLCNWIKALQKNFHAAITTHSKTKYRIVVFQVIEYVLRFTGLKYILTMCIDITFYTATTQNAFITSILVKNTLCSRQPICVSYCIDYCRYYDFSLFFPVLIKRFHKFKQFIHLAIFTMHLILDSF